ncbi:MAG: PD-(D/E)XK nuclease family protein [Bdellovibrionaceae bacterium]|nr:PD-(D/E)XK nuclease family protein [Pseudobdellovibrionaceae bacterium]
MLNVHKIQSIDDKIPLVTELFDEETLWVVSTAEAKRNLLNLLPRHEGVVATKNILRASEYWTWLLQMNRVDCQPISDSFFFVLLEHWYKKAEVGVEFRDIEKFKTFCDQIFPVLISAEKELFLDWLESEDDRKVRLGPWVDQATAFLRELKSFGFVSRSAMIGEILRGDHLYFGNYKRIVFDLGNEIQAEEVQMIEELARRADVFVLAPEASFIASYRTGKCYQKLDTEYGGGKKCESEVVGLRAAGVLVEIKQITSYVRELLDKGVALSEIALTSAEPEAYWDMLKKHFDVEGIPLEKSVVTKVSSLPVFQNWISHIKVLLRHYTAGDLESFLSEKNYFSRDRKAYVLFKKNFSRFYDMERGEEIIGEKTTWDPEVSILFSDFISFLYATWKDSDYSLFNKLIDALIKDFKEQVSLPLLEWHNYLLLLVSRLENRIEPGSKGGISFTSCHQLDYHPYKHLIVLGCHRGAMQSTSRSPFSLEDVTRLDNDLGYYLPPFEDKKVEIDIRWAMTSQKVTTLLSFSETDFNSDPIVASQMWLELTQGKSFYESSRVPRWDAIMRQSLDVFTLGDNGSSLVREKLGRETSAEKWPDLQSPFQGRLSASSFNRYHQCPFIFMAEKVFLLPEMKEFDLEIDVLFQGNILHKILELLLGDYPNLDFSDAQLMELYHRVLNDPETTGNVSPDILQYWQKERFRHFIMIRRFIEAEKQWRAEKPHVRVVALEGEIKGFVGIDGERFVLSQEKMNVTFLPFSGRIDRIDINRAGEYGIYDYKTSKHADLKAFDRWPETFQVQMPLYAEALENGLVDKLSPASVVMAAYIFLKDGTRGSGFVTTDTNGDFSQSQGKRVVNREEREEVFQQINDKLKNVFQKIQTGEYTPHPEDEEICTNCNWRKTCRAPHLR